MADISIEIRKNCYMKAHTSMLHIRMDDQTKARAAEALAAMGLSASDAVRILFHRIAVDQAFPLELKVPNAETRAAIAEAEKIARSGKFRFDSADDMFAALDGDRGE